MPDCTPGRHRHQIETLRIQFALANGLPLADNLPGDRLRDALREEAVQGRQVVYTLVLTLWIFLTQVISPYSSRRAALAHVLVQVSHFFGGKRA